MSVESILTLSISIIALVVAVYGAVLGTQARNRERERDQREIERERRRIRIFLDWVYFLEIAQLTITNVGHRPITITGISMQPEESDQVPSNSLFNDRHLKQNPLPITLTDGETIGLPLSDAVSGILTRSGMKAAISVHDAEGNVFSEYETRTLNPKWTRM